MPDRPTPRQIRGARAMLGWSMLDLAKAAGLSVSTVKRAEEAMPEAVAPDTMGEIRTVLEAAGVGFAVEARGVEVLRFDPRAI